MIVDLTVTTATGLISLNTTPYRLSGETFGSASVTHRRTELKSPYLEGTYVVNSLRENIIETVSVWVGEDGLTESELEAAVTALTEALDQVQFQAVKTKDGHSVLWNCYASDYTRVAQREYQHAGKVRVDVQLVRDPKVVAL